MAIRTKALGRACRRCQQRGTVGVAQDPAHGDVLAKKEWFISPLMDPPANPGLGFAGERLLFFDRTLVAGSGFMTIRESFSSSLGRLGRIADRLAGPQVLHHVLVVEDSDV